MLYKNIGADGVKTGYLAVEKYSLASSMKKNDRRLIAVASGFQQKFKKFRFFKTLNWGYRNTNTFEISKKNGHFLSWILGCRQDKIKAVTKEDFYITINKKDIRNLKVTLNYEGPIVAPIFEDEKIAELVVLNKNEVLKKLPLHAAKS